MTETLPPCDQYQLQGEAFSRAVRGEIVLPYGIEDAIANMRVIDALFRSELSGRWEAIAPRLMALVVRLHVRLLRELPQTIALRVDEGDEGGGGAGLRLIPKAPSCRGTRRFDRRFELLLIRSRIAGGVPFGAKSPAQWPIRTPENPCSCAVGSES